MAQVHLQIQGISCSYGAEPILNDLQFSVQKGELLGIIGPNGSGKTTLLKAMSRTLKPHLGRVFLADQDIYRLKAPEVARQMAVVPQENHFDFPFAVVDCNDGRTPSGRSKGNLNTTGGVVEEA